MNHILGTHELHWASRLLGTEYHEFHSPMGIKGLAKETDDGKHLHILAVEAQYQGIGLFRSFIREAKVQYDQISVWVIGNPVIENALNRYGFTHTEQTHEGEHIEGMTWQKQKR